MNPEETEEKGPEPLLFGSHVRRELVLADLIRESLQEGTLESCAQDLTLLQVARALGPLEAEVMEVVWQKGEALVREVHQVLSRRREIAYTTVLTVLRNLNRKGMLRRERTDGSYIYHPCAGRLDFIQARVGMILDLLLDRFPGPTLTHLLKRMEREGG